MGNSGSKRHETSETSSSTSESETSSTSTSSSNSDNEVDMRDLHQSSDYLTLVKFIAMSKISELKDILYNMSLRNGRPLTRQRYDEYVVADFVDWEETILRKVDFDQELKDLIAQIHTQILSLGVEVNNLEFLVNETETSSSKDDSEGGEDSEGDE